MDMSARFKTPYNRRINVSTTQQTDNQAMVTQTNLPWHPKGPCFNCGEMGHFAAQCQRNNTRVNYMDYEEPNQIPMPMIQPQVNMAMLKAQIDTISL